ncbi:MAG: cytochrome c biogenesis protein CcsA, partial [Microthrixaceae bacterium]
GGRMTATKIDNEVTLQHAPTGTGSRGTKVLGAVALLFLVIAVVYGLVISPPDAQLGNTIRIIYMHVPTVMAAYLAFLITAVSSAMYLWKRTEFWDLLGSSAAEIGVLFFAVTIIDGALWGKVTWGVFWRWEPRLTTSAVLLIMYVGYLAVRAIPADPKTRATRCAIIGLVAVVNIPIVHKAVDWWRGLHQGKTVIGTVDPEMGGTQLFAMYSSLIAGILVCIWLLIHRFRAGYLAERASDLGLGQALEERKLESSPAAAASDRIGDDA